VQHFNERELREIRSDKTGRGARASGKKNVRGRTRLTCQTVQQIKAARSAASPTVNDEMVDRASGVVKVGYVWARLLLANDLNKYKRRKYLTRSGRSKSGFIFDLFELC
jgi:hypothetical protein